MTTRVASNIGHNTERKIGRKHSSGSLALLDQPPATAAATLGIAPRQVAMGIAGPTGQVTVMHQNGAQITLTLWIWNQAAAKWVKGGPVAGVYTQTSDNEALTTFSVPINALFYFQGSGTSADFFIGGSTRYEDNSTPDLAYAA